MPTWAAVANVQARLTYFTIGASSDPSTSEVSQWIDETEARIRGVLRAAGLSTSYSDDDSVDILTAIVADAVEGRIRLAWGSGTGGQEETQAGGALMGKFENFLEALRTNTIQLGSELAASGDVADSVQLCRSHVTDNDDDLTVENGDFDPKFSIGDVNY